MKLQDEILKLGRTLTVIIGVLGAVWYFGRAPFNEKVKEQIDQYIEGNEFQHIHRESFLLYLETAEFEARLDKYIDENNSNQVSFRKLLSIKMDIPEENVATEISYLYKKDKKRLINVLRLLTKEYPNSNLWDIE